MPGNGYYGYGPGDGPDRGYHRGGHPGDPRRPAGDQYGPGNGYDPRDQYGPGDPRRGGGYRSAEGYGYGPQGPHRGEYQRGGYRPRDDFGPPDYGRGEEYGRPVGYPPHPADGRYRQGWQDPAGSYRDFGPNGPYPGSHGPRGPFDQAGRGYAERADYGYGQGAPRFNSEIADGPIDSSAWSRPPERTSDERPEPTPVQSKGPPAALPAGPSALAAEPEPAADATAAVTSDDPPAADRIAEAAEAVELQPSAGAASPSGSIKPPPFASMPPEPPLPPDGRGPSTPVGSPAFGQAVGDDMVGPDDDTAPLPVILPDQMPKEMAQSARMRDPFEPIERQPGTQPDPAVDATSSPDMAKMDQIKDLYLTAEAIGEDALSKHFQQVSERQRQLIREYFDQVAARADGEPKN